MKSKLQAGNREIFAASLLKTLILWGGQGTRLREETEFRPQPMVDIGGEPILWHIMTGCAPNPRSGERNFAAALAASGVVSRAGQVLALDGKFSLGRGEFGTFARFRRKWRAPRRGGGNLCRIQLGIGFLRREFNPARSGDALRGL